MKNIEFWVVTRPAKFGQWSTVSGDIITVVDMETAFFPAHGQMIEMPVNGRMLAQICDSCESVQIR